MWAGQPALADDPVAADPAGAAQGRQLRPQTQLRAEAAAPITLRLQYTGEAARNGPSTYPDTSLAFRVHQTLDEHWSVQAAVADGVPDSVRSPNSAAITFSKTKSTSLIGEADFKPARTTKLMGGYRDYTGTSDVIGRAAATGSDRLTYRAPIKNWLTIQPDFQY